MIRVSEEVRDALSEGRAVVALESTVYSNLGLPDPDNAAALSRSIAAARGAGAVPAVTAVVDGVMCAGLESDEHERVLGSSHKTAERDLPVAVAGRWAVGVTTVSASLAIASRCGLEVFATGGIGGVHRDVNESGDVSADLDAIARHPVATVSAGAKSFLHLGRTLEQLDTLGVPVVGWRTDEFPAFTARSSGLPVPHRIDDVELLARIARVQFAFGRGLLVANPVPPSAALDQAVHDSALASALDEAGERGLSGGDVTPFVLDRIAAATGGASVPANIALLENNVRLAAELAVALAAVPATSRV